MDDDLLKQDLKRFLGRLLTFCGYVDVQRGSDSPRCGLNWWIHAFELPSLRFPCCHPESLPRSDCDRIRFHLLAWLDKVGLGGQIQYSKVSWWAHKINWIEYLSWATVSCFRLFLLPCLNSSLMIQSRGRHSRSHTSVTSMSINVAKRTFLCLTMNMLCILLL